jgi:hypothetical protein
MSDSDSATRVPCRSSQSLRINNIHNLGLFMASWDDPSHPRNLGIVDLRKTPYGNVNKTGIAGNYTAQILSRWHPQFSASLEIGIRNLVLVLIERFDWITYSSCEGHYYHDLGVVPVERHVGLLPRSKEESQTMNLFLNKIVNSINEECSSYAVRIVVIWETVESELGLVPVLGLRFRRVAVTSWESYFQLVDVPYNALVATLRQTAVVVNATS